MFNLFEGVGVSPLFLHILKYKRVTLKLLCMLDRLEWGNCRWKITLFTCTSYKSVNFLDLFLLFFQTCRGMSALQIHLKIIKKQLPKVVQSLFF